MKGCRFYAFLIVVITFLFTNSVGYAKEIQFTNTGYEKERQVVYKLLEEEIKDAERVAGAQHGKVDIEIAMEDLNNDGGLDMLILVRHHFFCGTEGCRFLVLIAERNGNWHKVFEGISHENIRISQHHTKGYNDIILSGGAVCIWNGKNYK